MRFQLVGVMKLWEEVHNDGGERRVNIDYEFESESYTMAIEESAAFVENRVKEYPKQGSYGEINFQSCKVTLREIKPIWTAETGSEQTKKLVEVEETKTILKGKNLT
ncbi:MAG: hypothetical protein G01um101419_313 [Parcubacteria group bacterium Gr01-1014_19]|nr:MAG: hypothetical protein G01um101419_313 [Parcubacteria group bacterium Gr01-1014_19]